VLNAFIPALIGDDLRCARFISVLSGAASGVGGFIVTSHISLTNEASSRALLLLEHAVQYLQMLAALHALVFEEHAIDPRVGLFQ
jgi:hypothetical protein